LISLNKAMKHVEADAVQLKYEDEENVVHITVQQNLRQILAKVRPVIAKYSFTAEKYQAEVPRVLQRLKAGIAPIETYDKESDTTRPVTLRSVLNAGWELYKIAIDNFYNQFVPGSKEKEMEYLENLNHLLFKAIEASEVIRRWK